MTISAKMILSSTCVPLNGMLGHERIDSLELMYPKFIHGEFMTHRVFSRNASSSRAIPVKRQIEMIIEDTAMPIHWGANEPGMQARREHTTMVDYMVRSEFAGRVDMRTTARDAWLHARDRAIEMAEAFANAGYHKQIVNRLLEPFMHIKVIVTSDDWNNFMQLRLHKDAQPEIQELAKCIAVAQADCKPQILQDGEWHLPYITKQDIQHRRLSSGYQHHLDKPVGPKDYEPVIRDLCMISAARCARVSYLNHDRSDPDQLKDLELYQRLASAVPWHASPMEHQATPAQDYETNLTGNFKGWGQFRKFIETETPLKCD